MLKTSANKQRTFRQEIKSPIHTRTLQQIQEVASADFSEITNKLTSDQVVQANVFTHSYIQWITVQRDVTENKRTCDNSPLVFKLKYHKLSPRHGFKWDYVLTL